MKRHIWIAVIFFLLTVAITFPLVFKVTTYIPGFFTSDENIAPLWDSWRIKHTFLHKTSFTRTSMVAYPFGVDLYASGYFSYLWIGILFLLSVLTTPVLTYNIQIFTNLFLSGIFTYLLVLHCTKDRLSAFLSGVIFAFCPYQFMRAWQHLSLTYSQWIPLCLLTMILLKKQGIKRNFILFLLSLLLLLSFDYSIMYLGTITLGCFFMYGILFQLKIKFLNKKCFFNADRKFIKNVFIAVILAAIILTPQFFPIIKNRLKLSTLSIPSAWNAYHRPFEDLFFYSAKPLSYFLPAVVHPIFGKFTEYFVGDFLYGHSFTEHTLYLGWVPIILAFIAFKRWRKRRIMPLGENEAFYIGFFVLLVIVGWLFSQPPWWNFFHKFKIFMPSFFMYKILPMFRAYCRFGIVVMLAVAVLAGFGLKIILQRFKTQRAKIIITTLFCGLVLFEFWNYPPFKVIDVSKVPKVYYWLKQQSDDFVIVEYPLDANGPNELYKFYQTKHEKKIINGTIPGTYANEVAKIITRLSELKTAGVLKWMGAKYVLVHKNNYLMTELIEDREELKKIAQNSGLKFVKGFSAQECPRQDIMCIQKTGPIDVYEVIARPIKPDMIEKGLK